MTAADLFGALIFGCVGLSAFMVGKKRSDAKLMLTGFLLMGYPYAMPNTLMLYIVGGVLTLSLFVFK
ncbi:MAG: amino acid transport protein [Planctomycetes bacterium]|nr:amino acid transport protein [Planctomycetota bacterium]